LAGLSTVGLYYLSAADTWAPVTIGANLSFNAGTLAASGGGGSSAWADITGKPTTLAGYGITDAQPLRTILTNTTASYTTAEQSKLSLIAAGATANATDAQLRDRATHTGTQAWGTITGAPTTRAGYGITDAQPLDAGLTALAGLSTVGLYYLSAADTWSPVTIGANLTFTSGTLAASGGGGGGGGDAVLAANQTFTGLNTFSAKTTFGASVSLGAISADPGTPANGDMWYNTTEGRFKGRSNGSTMALDAQRSLPFLTPVAGEYTLPGTVSANGLSTLAGGANRIDLAPFILGADITVVSVSLNVTAAVASALAKIILYESDEFGRPSTLILETTDLDCSTTGFKGVACSVPLRAGRTYWRGVRHSSTATLSVINGTVAHFLNAGTRSTSAQTLLRRVLTYATAAPNPWVYTSSEVGGQNPPAIWLED
jgi:hypothetical protein